MTIRRSVGIGTVMIPTAGSGSGFDGGAGAPGAGAAGFGASAGFAASAGFGGSPGWGAVASCGDAPDFTGGGGAVGEHAMKDSESADESAMNSK